MDTTVVILTSASVGATITFLGGFLTESLRRRRAVEDEQRAMRRAVYLTAYRYLRTWHIKWERFGVDPDWVDRLNQRSNEILAEVELFGSTEAHDHLTRITARLIDTAASAVEQSKDSEPRDFVGIVQSATEPVVGPMIEDFRKLIRSEIGVPV